MSTVFTQAQLCVAQEFRAPPAHLETHVCTVAGNSASSVCLHVTGRLPLDRFTVEFDIGGGNTGQFLWRPQCDLLFSTTQIRNKRICVQQTILSYCWQWHITQQYTTRCCFFHNNGYANMPQRHTKLPIVWSLPSVSPPITKQCVFCFKPHKDLDSTLGLQEVKTPRTSWQSVHKCGEVVSSRHRQPLPSPPPPRDTLGTHFC